MAASILFAMALFAYFHNEPNRTGNIPKTPNSPSETVHSSDSAQLKSLQDNPDKKQINSNADKPPAPINTDASSKQQVKMTASVNSTAGMVYIRGGINYPVAGGSCYALLSGPSGQSVRKDTTTLQNPASTDCKTISIPANELGVGKWIFTLHYTSDNYEGISNEAALTL